MEWVDLALTPVLLVWFWLEVTLIPTVTNKPAAFVIGSAVVAGLAFRRSHPLILGWGTQLLLSLTEPHVTLAAGPVTIAWFCALYALAVWTSTWWFIASVAMVVVANGWTGLLDFPHPSVGAQFGLVAALVMLLVRLAVGGRDRQLRLAEREREVAAREAVVDERARIARELHDVIAHHVSTMVVQAGAERRTLPSDQQETREVLASIEQVGRGALTEMRRMVSMLRQDHTQDLAPQPRLADVPELVHQMQAAGLTVGLTVRGEPRELSDGLELSAYRIVQEALTNVLKHAGSTDTRVEVAYGADSLELIVRDAGPQAPLIATSSGGHGLAGMRERVSLYGGTLEAGGDASGGFRVRVLLPVG